jgi:hypothetical protein
MKKHLKNSRKSIHKQNKFILISKSVVDHELNHRSFIKGI